MMLRNRHAYDRARLSITGSILHRTLGAMLAVTLALSLITNTAVAEVTAVEFDIPAQSVSSALRAYAQQAKVQLLVLTDGLNAVQANAVVGRLDPQRALDALLAGTGLHAQYRSDATVMVERISDLSGDSVGMTASDNTSHWLAQMNVESNRQVTDVGGLQTRQTAASEVSSEKRNQDAAIEEIVVTGSNIRGVEPIGATMIVVTREEIAKTGFSTVAEVFESLPQNLDEIGIDGSAADGVSQTAGANTQLASGISLRGLGPGSTLVLVNGKRRPASVRGRVVDVSTIPLSIIEKIEVITGGRSAVYGSDAVAGVVNIVTVTELDGAETQVYYGEATAGAERFNFSQTFGRKLDRGGFVLAYDYSNEQELDATDTGLVQAPSIAGATPLPGLFRIRAPSEQHVGTFVGHYRLSGKVELYADAQYSSDTNEGGQIFDCCGGFEVGGVFTTDSDQYSAAAGVRLDIGKGWQLDVSGHHGEVDNDVARSDFSDVSGTFTTLDIAPEEINEDGTKLTSLSATADGPLGQLGRHTVSGAIGTAFRDESFERNETDLSTGDVTPFENLDRQIWSIFGEVHLAVVPRGEQRFELSLAGRYDDYSDFGNTFNPQIGVEWQPINALSIQGSYSEAFRAPDLFALGFGTVGRVRIVGDPLAPGTTVALFSELGGNPHLQPEEADTYTLGIEWTPSDNSALSVSYFSIKYEGRIDQPSPSDRTALEDEILFPGLVNRDATPEQLEALLNRITQFINSSGIPFDPAIDDPFAIFSNIAIFDNRRNNIGLEEINGFDFRMSTELETRSGNWSFGLNGTHTLDFTRNFTVTSPEIDQLDQPGKPVDLKFRGHIGWSRSPWNVNADITYVDSYDDTIAAVLTKIDSWTTVDLTLRYDGSQATDGGIFDGLIVTLGINNAFDEDPPVFLSNLLGLGYDGVNASPLGRFMSLRLAKRW